ncbi:MAG: hypothetical protein WCY77_10345 [Weeksellaceae bacterium]
MKQFILLILFVLFSCTTKKKAVEITKSQALQTERLESSSSGSSSVSTNVETSALSAYDFAEMMGKWSIDYNGEMNDSFRFYVNQTENGWEAGADGKGSAAASTETREVKERLEVNYKEKFDSLRSYTDARFVEYETRIETLEKTKTNEKNAFGFQAGFYIFLTVLGVVLILLFWLGWRFRKLSKLFSNTV